MIEASPNGTAKRVQRVKIATTKQAPPTIFSELTGTQRVSLCVGGLGCFVLLLSVWHCTEALQSLTGSPFALAVLLAIGVDLGMVACEVGSIIGQGKAKVWSNRYIGLAVLLSSILNSFASGKHAENETIWLAYVVGALIPVLVFILAKVSSHLWTESAD
jgi:hypothetical protein